jgi:hypothetical protein
MTICSMPSADDHFEFGSDGLGTFRNFLTAFDLSGHGTTNLSARSYAFDIFGDLSGTGTGTDADYFEHWSNARGGDKFGQARRILDTHNLFKDRFFLKKGYFQDTLTQEFKRELKDEGRHIGTLFLDCNIGESYLVVFDWSIDLIAASRCFVYMDEY